MIVTTKDVATLFSVTDRTVRKWGSMGCPRAGHGKWNLLYVLPWWLDNIYQADMDSDDINEAKRRYWSAKADNEELKASQKKGNLLSKDEIGREWSKRAAEYKSGCFELENSLPPLLEGKSQAKMRNIIYEKVWSIFDRVVRTGRFTEDTGKKKSKGKKKKK